MDCFLLPILHSSVGFFCLFHLLQARKTPQEVRNKCSPLCVKSDIRSDEIHSVIFRIFRGWWSLSHQSTVNSIITSKPVNSLSQLWHTDTWSSHAHNWSFLNYRLTRHGCFWTSGVKWSDILEEKSTRKKTDSTQKGLPCLHKAVEQDFVVHFSCSSKWFICSEKTLKNVNLNLSVLYICRILGLMSI